MLPLEISKPLTALHVWAFIPVPLGTSQELAHSVEHRIFLDPKIAALEDETVRHNGMTFWSGIRLEFTVQPERYGELRSALSELFAKPLPKMSFEERERFARELEEGGGDFFDRAIERFRKAFAESNGFEHSGKDEDAIWRSLDFASTRLLAVGAGDAIPASRPRIALGQKPAEAFGQDPEAHPWSPALHPDLVFPTLKEEIEARKEDDEYGLTEPDSGMDYVLLFPSIVEDSRDFAFHSLFFQCLRLKADADFRDTGRTYDPVAEDYFENGFAVSGIHLMTSDTSKKLPALPKKPSVSEFEKMRDSLAFQNRIYLDQLLFGSFPVLGLDPEESVRSISEFPYSEFVERFDRAASRVSFFWGRG